MKLFRFNPFTTKGFSGLYTRFEKYGNKLKSNLAFLANELRTIRYLIKDYFNVNYIKSHNLIHELTLIFGCAIIISIAFINEIELIYASIIPFFSFRNFIKHDKHSRYKRLVMFINDEFIWNVFKRNAIRLKINIRPIARQVMTIIHVFKFYEKDDTKLKFTVKYRNKKNDIYGELYDLRIDFSNLSYSQIVAIFSYSHHKLPLKEQSELIDQLDQCYAKFSEVFYDKLRAYIPKPTKKTKK